ncbi:hypothetical protein N8583_02780, partial [Akkermansiaceae bacterium]|nr:hypothetical protein [Akkermansiaceae bacterium]
VDGNRLGNWPQQAAGSNDIALTGDLVIGATQNGANNMTGQLDDFAILSGPMPISHIQSIAAGASIGSVYNLGPQDLVITGIMPNIAGSSVTLTWASEQSASYAIQFASTLTGSEEDWVELEDGVTSQGESTTQEVGGIDFASFPKLFFRVSKEVFE